MKLIINPNTTLAITQRIGAAAHALPASQGHAVQMMTASFGAPYISDEASYAIAGHAVLEAWGKANKHAPITGALIACFGDPGLWALREVAGLPVTGLAEASFIAASRYGSFALVTGGAKWQPILQRLAHALGYSDKLKAIHTLELTGAQLAADPAAAVTALHQACEAVLTRHKVDALIIGGAGLAGYAAQFAHLLPVPVIDSVQAGLEQLFST
jgi:allantoin racemase